MTAGQPVWVTAVVSSSYSINALLLDAQFGASDTGDSTLSVYLAGNLIGLVDETTTGANATTFLFPLNGTLPPGTYDLSYRLDPTVGDSSSVVIMDSNFLLTSVLPGDANVDGRVNINDLTIVLTNYGRTVRLVAGLLRWRPQRHGGYQRPDRRAGQLRHDIRGIRWWPCRRA